MDLFTIQHELIADRPEDAWYQTAVSGPFFHYRWSSHPGPDGEGVSSIIGEHRHHAVCREEPSLTMSWGMEVYDQQEREELHFEWAQMFPDPAVRPLWVDFFWNNALIDRVQLCRIDGGHGIIPVPDGRREVTDFEVAVAYLVHNLAGAPSHDHPGRYLESIGAGRVRDQERHGAGSTSKATT